MTSEWPRRAYGRRRRHGWSTATVLSGAGALLLVTPLLLRATLPTAGEAALGVALLALAGPAALRTRRARRGAAAATPAEPPVVPRATVAALGHELRTPLTAAVGHLDRLVADSTVAPDGRERAEAASAAIHRASALLGEFLTDPAAWLPGASVPDSRPVDLDALVREALTDFGVLAARRRISISFDSAGPGFVPGDSRRLRQVVDNLLSNAVKYNEVGGWVDVRLALAATQEGQQVSMEVVNPRATVDDDEATRVFEPTFRGPDARTLAEGHGIGLAVTRRIVAAHGGDVSLVSSRATDTTTTRLTLPAAGSVDESG